MFVLYHSTDADHEVLITTKELEEEFIFQWSKYRNLNLFQREEKDDVCISISPMAIMRIS